MNEAEKMTSENFKSNHSSRKEKQNDNINLLKEGKKKNPEQSQDCVTENKFNVERPIESKIAHSNDQNDFQEAGNSKFGLLKNSEFNLPNTTIVLETDWGSKVYVVGTAHFSEQSQEDVARVIKAVQPNFVVLELCESRSYMLKWEENEILKIAEKMEFKMFQETIRTYGMLQGVMYLLLLSVSAQITRELGMAPGGEFRRAYKEADQIPGCIIHLGDRPIEITLRRAFASLSWWQSIKFACYVIFSKKKIDENDIEKCKNRDYLEEMLAMLGGEFPELKNVFVNERDLFLAYSLMNASMLSTGQQGIIPNTVVGVVGIGHLAGIQRNWGKFDPMELRRVLQVPSPSKTSRGIKFTLKASVLVLALFGVHKIASKFECYASLFR